MQTKRTFGLLFQFFFPIECTFTKDILGISATLFDIYFIPEIVITKSGVGVNFVLRLLFVSLFWQYFNPDKNQSYWGRVIWFSAFFCFRDLSYTAIMFLPTEGLREIDVLKVQNTESLKVFPSVYNFKVNIIHILVIDSVKIKNFYPSK